MLFRSGLIIAEGLFVLWDSELRQLLTHKVFLDVDADVRVIRRIIRDAVEFGVDIEQACDHYLNVIRPMNAEFVERTKVHADLVIKWPMSIEEQVGTVLKVLGIKSE